MRPLTYPVLHTRFIDFVENFLLHRILLGRKREVGMVKGSCLCGEIEYEVELVDGKVFNCHCSQCRKSHGAAFATQAFAKGETLKFSKGEELLGEYKGSKGIRAFCKNCGSRLMNYAPDKDMYLSVALSCVDSEVIDGPVAHANVEFKAPWHSPAQDIPSFQGIPDGALD